MGETMMNLINIKGYQNRLRGIDPTYGRNQGFLLHWEALANFESRHGTWCLCQVLHNIVVVAGPCIWIMFFLSKNAFLGVKQCV